MPGGGDNKRGDTDGLSLVVGCARSEGEDTGDREWSGGMEPADVDGEDASLPDGIGEEFSVETEHRGVEHADDDKESLVKLVRDSFEADSVRSELENKVEVPSDGVEADGAEHLGDVAASV